MANKVSIIVAHLVIITAVSAVRVSPKLDFEESNVGSAAAIRSDNGYRVVKSSFTPDVPRHPNIEVMCVSGNCNSAGGLSADVVVRIKTNSDSSKVKNATTLVEPDIPVVIGVRSGGQDARPVGTPYASSYSSIVAPSATGFLQPSYTYPNLLQPSPQVVGYDNVNYAQAFPIMDNVVNTFFETALGTVNRPGETPYPKGVGSYNPVEFRKTYSNTWTPIKWSNSAVERRNAVPRWTPCTCQNPESHYDDTLYYQPPGVSGQVSALV